MRLSVQIAVLRFMRKMSKKVLMSGNEAIGEGAIRAGCIFYAGYPITPQNELTAYMAKHLPAQGGVFIQAESEVSAINMVFGAAAAGARAMTSSSSPGISLKQEGISYLAGAQLPAVVVNIMRGGPGLGNIAPAQSDYFQATKGGGHGDYRCIVLAPSCVQEAYDFTQFAFLLADRYRNPVLVLGDGMLGQMMEPLELKEKRFSLSLKNKKDWALTGCMGRSPNIVHSFYLKEGLLEKFNLLLQKKYKQIKKKETHFEEREIEDAQIVIISYGTMARIVSSVVKNLRNKGKKIGLFRPKTLWPFPEERLRQIAARNKGLLFLVVEMSYGQMLEDVRLAVQNDKRVRFLGRGGGGIPSEKEISSFIKKMF